MWVRVRLSWTFADIDTTRLCLYLQDLDLHLQERSQHEIPLSEKETKGLSFYSYSSTICWFDNFMV